MVVCFRLFDNVDGASGGGGWVAGGVSMVVCQMRW